MPDYRPPGVYITAQETPSVSVPGAGITKVGLVAKALSTYAGDLLATEFNYFDSVVAKYGEIDLSALNHITLGAYFAFKGGAPAVICAPFPSTGARADIDDAIAELETKDVKLVVVIDDGVATWDGTLSSLKTHCTNMSAAQRERIGLISAQSEAVISDITADATGCNNKRIVLFAPGSFKWTPPVSGATQLTVSAGFIAAYAAGLIASQEPFLPITRKQIPFIEALGSAYTVTDMNTLAAAGVTVVEQYYNTYRIRHALTTVQGSSYYKEASVVRAEDRLLEILRYNFDQLIPMPQNESTLPGIGNYCKAILESQKKEGLIYDYRNIQAKQNETEPRQVDISFEYKPSFPLNWVDIKFAIFV